MVGFNSMILKSWRLALNVVLVAALFIPDPGTRIFPSRSPVKKAPDPQQWLPRRSRKGPDSTQFQILKKETNADPYHRKSFLLSCLFYYLKCRKKDLPGWRVRGPAVRAPACPSAASGTASQSPSTAVAAPVTVRTQKYYYGDFRTKYQAFFSGQLYISRK